MFFHRCSYKNSCFSELACDSSVFVLIQWTAAWNSIMFLSQKCCLGLRAFGFEAMPHPSCYLTFVMDKTYHGAVVAPFSMQLQQLLQLRWRCPSNQPFFTAIVIFHCFLTDRYILAIQQIITHEEHLRYSFWSVHGDIISFSIKLN